MQRDFKRGASCGYILHGDLIAPEAFASSGELTWMSQGNNPPSLLSQITDLQPI